MGVWMVVRLCFCGGLNGCVDGCEGMLVFMCV